MIQIGKLQIDLVQREIRHDGAMLRVGSRAFDILELLIHAEGAVVSKDEIMRRVWPTSFVEENNLQVHIAALRKALGDDRDLIRTVPGRGYQLVSPRAPAADAGRSAQRSGAHGMPASVPRLVGRDTAVCEIVTLLAEVPELTLIGAGGIGKTSLAIQVAHQIGGQFRDGVRFVELAALTGVTEVLAAVAQACDLPLAGSAPGVKQIAEALADQQCLIVLDNAEHVIDVVTELVATLLAHGPQLRILVTSREPLRVDCEAIFRVQPLEVPAADAPVDQVFAHSAVQLFVCRVRSMGYDLGADPQTMRRVGDICRRLDGIALAIELAAARAVSLGIEGVYSRLDDRLQLLTGGHRNSLPRHQTLRATFEWSYGLLDPISRTVFRRLGVFVGAFTFEAVCAVATDPDLPLGSVIASISDLACKSLLSVEFEGAVAHYRLSESTRAYAMDKLRDEGELQQITARYTRFMQRSAQAQGDCLESMADASPDFQPPPSDL
jgi:predicted ATPase/DNA-binding winged helix-turn-helix (wHTH) protein